MNRQSWLLNLSLLKTHPAFRAVFLARFISIVSLGLLGVAVRQRDVCWPDGRRRAGGSL